MAPPGVILKVDLFGRALALEEFSRVIARGGAPIVISSMAASVSPRSTRHRNKHWQRLPLMSCCSCPGVIMTPLAQTELGSERGPAFLTLLDSSPARRAGTVDEVASLAAFLLGPEAGFITGGDFLMHGGVTPLRAVSGAKSAVQG
ncbi:MAG: SDR family oxidoreductase [Acidimicrobiales bacterium]